MLLVLRAPRVGQATARDAEGGLDGRPAQPRRVHRGRVPTVGAARRGRRWRRGQLLCSFCLWRPNGTGGQHCADVAGHVGIIFHARPHRSQRLPFYVAVRHPSGRRKGPRCWLPGCIAVRCPGGGFDCRWRHWWRHQDGPLLKGGLGSGCGAGQPIAAHCSAPCARWRQRPAAQAGAKHDAGLCVDSHGRRRGRPIRPAAWQTCCQRPRCWGRARRNASASQRRRRSCPQA
mmetsp:Transcript_4372/g.12621  ORF Transcript_4372/g.12621 Transcript_4372/m.12621 type:complete len:231 (-) Transcript_4372:2957-3649(-)